MADSHGGVNRPDEGVDLRPSVVDFWGGGWIQVGDDSEKVTIRAGTWNYTDKVVDLHVTHAVLLAQHILDACQRIVDKQATVEGVRL